MVTTRLRVAGNIRAMPEPEIPPARVDFYLQKKSKRDATISTHIFEYADQNSIRAADERDSRI